MNRRDVGGWARLVDTMPDLGPFQKCPGFIYTLEGVDYHFADRGASLWTGGLSSGLPLHLRLVWYAQDAKVFYPKNAAQGDARIPRYVGPIIHEVTVPVASRIPQTVVDDVMRGQGGLLRVKVRAHAETLMVGWDVSGTPSLAQLVPSERQDKNPYLPPGFRHTGGDFKERRLARYVRTDQGLKPLPDGGTYKPPIPKEWADQGLYLNSSGQLLEKGWYIDPCTGQRIETTY